MSSDSPEAELQPVLVNLGCGMRYHVSWKNFDLHSRTPDVLACNFLDGIPLSDDSVDAVYCAAVLEHVRPAQVQHFLRECFRVLKPNGILRVSVPDFQEQLRRYLDLTECLESGDKNVRDKLEWITIEIFDQFSRDKSGGEMAEFLATKGRSNIEFVKKRLGKEATNLIPRLERRKYSGSVDLKGSSGLVRGGWLGLAALKLLLKSRNVRADLAALEVGRFRLFSGEVHRWAYSRKTLASALKEAGFEDCTRKEHGVSNIPNWREFHLEVDENNEVEKPDLVVVEARKPPQQNA